MAKEILKKLGGEVCLEIDRVDGCASIVTVKSLLYDR